MTAPAARAPKFVTYLRVSTDKQGRSGLGLEAQREACASYVAGIPGAEMVGEPFIEVESGKRNDRPQLQAAIAKARATGATVLIAKLDRLSRDAHFLIGLTRADLVPFAACDLPGANSFTWGIMALVAQQEREAISARTKAALAQAKARGTKLGNPNGAAHLRGRGNNEAVSAIRSGADAFAATIAPTIATIRASGISSANAIAGELNAQGILTARGGKWTARSVLNLLARLEGAKAIA